MKKIISISILLLLFQAMFSQNCEEISPFKEGMAMEYTNYNKKGKVKSVDDFLVTSVGNKDGELIIEIETSVEDEKSKSAPKKTVLKCANGDFYIDMSNYVAHQSDNQDGNLEIKAAGDFLEFPDNMESGSVLEDGNIELSIGDEESTFTLANMTVSNRKVLEVGSITTGAGTFEGYKMSYDFLFAMGILKIRGSGVEWYVKGIGIVKTESYKKNGKLRWTRELTKISGQ